jgi:hypothetical protein
MNFFKKALIATAVAGTFGSVQAADLTDAVTKTSAQGLQVASAAANTSLRVIVREQLEAGDKITLVFGAGVTAIASVTLGGASTGANNLGIQYGTGTFEMENAVVSTATNGIQTVTFSVKTGDPVPKDASFEVAVNGGNISIAKAASATVTYSAISGLTGNAKDTTGDNTGALVITADQFGSSISTSLDAVIERAEQKKFISGYPTGNDDADTLVIKITDNQALLSPAEGDDVQAKIVVAGDFSSTSITGVIAGETGNNNTLPTGGAMVVADDEKSASWTINDTTAANDGIAGTYTITFDNVGGVIKASEFTTTVTVDADDTSATNTIQTTQDKVASGEWKIDATIINVPYMPVGYEGTSTSVHFSNLGPKADVIVEAVSVVDADGKSVVYKAKDLGFDLAANSVTKVSQTAIMSALSIPAGSHKLSVTFNIDGKTSDVSAYAYTQAEGKGRSEISNSQSKK